MSRPAAPAAGAPDAAASPAGLKPRNLKPRNLKPRNLKPLLRLLALLRPYRAHIAVALAGVVVGSSLTLAGPLAMRYLVDAVVPGGDPTLLGKATLALIVIYLTQGAFSYLRAYFLRLVGLRVTIDLRLLLYRHLQQLPLGFFARKRTGELVSRLMNDVATVRQLLTSDIASTLAQAITFVGALVLIFLTNWRLTLFMLVLVPSVVIISLFLGKRVRVLSTDVQDELAAATTVVEESIAGVRIVRSFAREQHEVGRFSGRLDTLFAVALKRLHLQVMVGPLLTVLFFATVIVLLWYGGRQVLAGELTTGQLVTFIALTSTMGGSISYFGNLWTRLQETLGSSRRVLELLDEEPEPAWQESRPPLPATAGRIAFAGVGFAYPPMEEGGQPVPVLAEIDLEVAPGEVLAVVGPSGAGKTTLVNLIPRFYDPTAGRVAVDGHDLKEVDVKSLREQIALVPQDPYLFGGSVRDNLLYGKLDATDDELVAAAEAANADGFIRDLPDGYDTVVGERGVRLSGGQRQRLAIARALLKDPRILLLDEATSALDSESEALVQEALERLMQGRTTVVIAHRLSTVRHADRIAVLDAGRLVGLGSHRQLMAEGGLYARLYRRQFRERPGGERATVGGGG